jgi:hypothetical protein
MRVPFESVFTLIDGRIIAKNHVAIDKFIVAAGVSLSPTLIVWGDKIGTLTTYDLVIEDEDGIVVVVGIYRGNDLPDSIS